MAVAALEDKIVQRAVAAVLSVIYEEDFLGFSYGFRPKRSQHDALDALIVGIGSRKVNYILDADIRSFFTEVSQQWVVRFLKHRIGDKRIIRLVQKWLRSGILEDGIVTIEEKGTGQGSVISPLLSNIYLHYVFDLWADGTVNLSGWVSGCRRLGLRIEVYCQPMLQISSQTRNVWVLEARCCSAGT